MVKQQNKLSCELQLQPFVFCIWVHVRILLPDHHAHLTGKTHEGALGIQLVRAMLTLAMSAEVQEGSLGEYLGSELLRRRILFYFNCS